MTSFFIRIALYDVFNIKRLIGKNPTGSSKSVVIFVGILLMYSGTMICFDKKYKNTFMMFVGIAGFLVGLFICFMGIVF